MCVRFDWRPMLKWSPVCVCATKKTRLTIGQMCICLEIALCCVMWVRLFEMHFKKHFVARYALSCNLLTVDVHNLRTALQMVCSVVPCKQFDFWFFALASIDMPWFRVLLATLFSKMARHQEWNFSFCSSFVAFSQKNLSRALTHTLRTRHSLRARWLYYSDTLASCTPHSCPMMRFSLSLSLFSCWIETLIIMQTGYTLCFKSFFLKCEIACGSCCVCMCMWRCQTS